MMQSGMRSREDNIVNEIKYLKQRMFIVKVTWFLVNVGPPTEWRKFSSEIYLYNIHEYSG